VQRIQLSQAERAGVRIDDNSLNAALTEIAQQNAHDFGRLSNQARN
jgi:DNA-binding TFAR19-related protein (PDSD5 family)